MPGFLLALEFFQPWPPSEVSMAPCTIYRSISDRAFPGCFFWVSAPLGRASLRAWGPHSPHFPREMFCAQRPWLTSDRKFLACSLHAERKLMAQELRLGKEKGTGNDSRVSGWKTPAGAWRGWALVWKNWWVLYRAVDQAESAWAFQMLLHLMCLHLSIGGRCSGLFYIHWASRLSQPSSKRYCGFVSFLPHHIINSPLSSMSLDSAALRRKVAAYTEPHVNLQRPFS